MLSGVTVIQLCLSEGRTGFDPRVEKEAKLFGPPPHPVMVTTTYVGSEFSESNLNILLGAFPSTPAPPPSNSRNIM